MRVRAAALAAVAHRVMRCHVNLELAHRYRHIGKHYRVRISLVVPGAELVVWRNPQPRPALDLHASVDAAFDDMGRMLHDYMERRREDERAACY